MTTRGTVVVDAGPLIALALLDKLDLLRVLHGDVTVPAAVFAEVTGAGEERPGAREVAAASFLRRVHLDQPPDPLLLLQLGRGEAEVIALAHRQGAALVLLDDLRARRVAAHAYGLQVRGTAGLLVAARRAGAVEAVRPLLEQIRADGYRLSDALVDRACREVGE